MTFERALPYSGRPRKAAFCNLDGEVKELWQNVLFLQQGPMFKAEGGPIFVFPGFSGLVGMMEVNVLCIRQGSLRRN
jgi:hypothetical protein